MSAEFKRRALYIDASALVKLVLSEPESAAVEALASTSQLFSSAIVTVETHRAILVAGGGDALRARADAVIATVALVEVTEPIRAAAASAEPQLLRTLEAIHLASALGLGDQLDAMLVYDRRLSEAAVQAGLIVSAPGTD